MLLIPCRTPLGFVPRKARLLYSEACEQKSAGMNRLHILFYLNEGFGVIVAKFN